MATDHSPKSNHAITSTVHSRLASTPIDAEALFNTLADFARPLLTQQDPLPNWHLVGIASGGAWLAQRLAKQLQVPFGVISSTMHRDDFAHRGLGGSGTANTQTHLPMPIDKAHILLLDDVLFTGRTIRAALNELYDYGRPAHVRLAVLVDRGGRELPVAADFAAATLDAHALGADDHLQLQRPDDNALGPLRFSLGLDKHSACTPSTASED